MILNPGQHNEDIKAVV